MLGVEVMVLFVLGILWMSFASVCDLKTKEVFDWLNYSFLLFVLGFRFFWSLFEEGSFVFFYWGLVGFVAFFILGNLFYYSRFFGGGDAKLMYGLGALLPISSSLFENLEFFIGFLLVFFLVGAVYGLIGSLFLMVRNWKAFRKEFQRQIRKRVWVILSGMFLGLILLGGGLIFLEEIAYLGILIFLMAVLFVFGKTIDKSAMIVKRKVSELREGDWLYKDVRVGKEIIKSNWEGLSKQEIKVLRRLEKDVLIREGIAYVPVFLISFISWIFLINSSFWEIFW
jgi:Flp pilus assembly protein protease CpaA